MSIFRKYQYVRHLKMEILLVIPASNDLEIETNN